MHTNETLTLDLQRFAGGNVVNTTTGQVNAAHRAVVHTVGEQQDGEVRGFHVLVDATRAEVTAAVGLNVYA